MSRRFFCAPASALAALLGAVSLIAFWAACLLGPAACMGLAAGALGTRSGVSASLVALGFAATVFALGRVLRPASAWRGM